MPLQQKHALIPYLFLGKGNYEKTLGLLKTLSFVCIETILELEWVFNKTYTWNQPKQSKQWNLLLSLQPKQQL